MVKVKVTVKRAESDELRMVRKKCVYLQRKGFCKQPDNNLTMRYKKTIIGMLLAVVAVSCGGSGNEGGRQEEVRVKMVEMGRQASSRDGGREYVGTIEESYASNLSFETTGRVTGMYVREGQKVACGQLLATVDTTAAYAAYAAARAALERAEDGYARARQMHDAGTMAEVKWVEVQAEVEQARSAAVLARRNLDNCRLYAPTSGVVSTRGAEVGTVVAPMQTVVRLVGMDRSYVRLDVPEVDVGKISIGERCKVRVPAAADTTVMDGVVEERSVEADMLSHSYRMRIRIVGGGGGAELLPGMVCRVRFSDDGSGQGFVVPRRAVQIDEEGHRYVWTVGRSGLAHRRYVAIGDLTDLGVVVDSGLAAGDRVVTDGMLKLAEGTKVAL